MSEGRCCPGLKSGKVRAGAHATARFRYSRLPFRSLEHGERQGPGISETSGRKAVPFSLSCVRDRYRMGGNRNGFRERPESRE